MSTIQQDHGHINSLKVNEHVIKLSNVSITVGCSIKCRAYRFFTNLMNFKNWRNSWILWTLKSKVTNSPSLLHVTHVISSHLISSNLISSHFVGTELNRSLTGFAVHFGSAQFRRNEVSRDEMRWDERMRRERSLTQLQLHLKFQSHSESWSIDIAWRNFFFFFFFLGNMFLLCLTAYNSTT